MKCRIDIEMRHKDDNRYRAYSIDVELPFFPREGDSLTSPALNKLSALNSGWPVVESEFDIKTGQVLCWLGHAEMHEEFKSDESHELMAAEGWCEVKHGP